MLITKRKLPKSKYQAGYTEKELRKFLTKKQYRQFCRNYGVQTGIIIAGEFIMYKHDVERALQELDLLD